VSSTPTQVFSSLDETKRFLNIPLSNTDSDSKIDVFRNKADNYINAQIDIHETIPITDPDPSLTSLSSSMAAVEFNYYQSPEKTDLREDVKDLREQIQAYLLAKYGRKNENLLAGGDTFGVTSAMTGNTTSTT